jgi:hypothetical protein
MGKMHPRSREGNVLSQGLYVHIEVVVSVEKKEMLTLVRWTGASVRHGPTWKIHDRG